MYLIRTDKLLNNVIGNKMLNFSLIISNMYLFSPLLDPEVPKNPCEPSPCGSNTYCTVYGDRASCQCKEDYNGDPYSRYGCQPECITSADCPSYLSCMNNKCKDPCTPQTCATEAQCRVTNHAVRCECNPGTTGDPYRYCEVERKYDPPREKDVCNPNPCGINALCRRAGSSYVCECTNNYRGNAYGYGCTPECSTNSECPASKSCINDRCVDPCINLCGYNARCHVANNVPSCTCNDRSVGDPFIGCTAIEERKDPCYPNPCAINGICRVVGDNFVCHYPECVQNDDCPRTKACFNQRCGDPCVGACGVGAVCNVVNHKAGELMESDEWYLEAL
jgi:hypothetical protein